MGAVTFLIGCLPSYASIGALAPALLVILRFLQAFLVGGEWGGAMLMVVEYAAGKPFANTDDSGLRSAY